jgi:hypothetical protein
LFGTTTGCGVMTSTDRANVRFSVLRSAPTLTTCRVTSSPRSLRTAITTKYSHGSAAAEGWLMTPSTRSADAAATWRFAAS